MKDEWEEICNRFIGALFSYTESTGLCMITRVRKVDGVLDFIYHRMQTNGEHAKECRYILDRRDVIWYRGPRLSDAERQKYNIKCYVADIDNSSENAKVK